MQPGTAPPASAFAGAQPRGEATWNPALQSSSRARHRLQPEQVRGRPGRRGGGISSPGGQRVQDPAAWERLRAETGRAGKHLMAGACLVARGPEDREGWDEQGVKRDLGWAGSGRVRAAATGWSGGGLRAHRQHKGRPAALYSTEPVPAPLSGGSEVNRG